MWRQCFCFMMLISCGKSAVIDYAADADLIGPSYFPLEITGKEINFFRINLNNETQLRGLRMPCQCIEGECGCCSGNILQNFNINIRQHLCINMTFEPEDLSIGVRMSINDLVLLSRRVSGRNPPPLCVNVPRIRSIKFCAKFTNVYFVDRNIHACITLETEWNERTVFSYSFDCVRLGLNGVALLPAEAGGGLPHPIDEEEDNIEEYDELLENQTTKKPTKPTKQPTKKTTTTTASSIATQTTTVKTMVTTNKLTDNYTPTKKPVQSVVMVTTNKPTVVTTTKTKTTTLASESAETLAQQE